MRKAGWAPPPPGVRVPLSKRTPPFRPLSATQEVYVELAVEGYNTEQIAEAFGVSERTVHEQLRLAANKLPAAIPRMLKLAWWVQGVDLAALAGLGTETANSRRALQLQHARTPLTPALAIERSASLEAEKAAERRAAYAAIRASLNGGG